MRRAAAPRARVGVRNCQAGRGVESWGGGRGQCGRPRTRAPSTVWGGVGRGCREPSSRTRWGPGAKGVEGARRAGDQRVRDRGAEGRGSGRRGPGIGGSAIGVPRAGDRVPRAGDQRVGDRGAKGRGSGRGGPGVRARRTRDPGTEDRGSGRGGRRGRGIRVFRDRPPAGSGTAP